MEQESNMQAPPTLCRSGCGFYGNPATEGMCSVCFKEAVKKKQQPPSPSSSTSIIVKSSTASDTGNSTFTLPAAAMAVPHCEAKEENQTEACTSVTCVTPDVAMDTPVAKEEKKKAKNRCGSCNKKVGLTGFECRCGGLYCAVHRYSDKHECTFNYRELGAEEIRRNNPVVVGQKIQKI